MRQQKKKRRKKRKKRHGGTAASETRVPQCPGGPTHPVSGEQYKGGEGEKKKKKKKEGQGGKKKKKKKKGKSKKWRALFGWRMIFGLTTTDTGSLHKNCKKKEKNKCGPLRNREEPDF